MKEALTAPRVRIAGISVDSLTENEVFRRTESFVANGGPHQIITANPLMIMASERDPALRGAFQSADLVVPDSIGVQWAALLQGKRLTKISGIDLMDHLCGLAVQRGWRVFFLGGKPGVSEAAAQVLKARYPGLIVTGTHHGYFRSEKESPSESELLSFIGESKPDILFVGLATPFQDGWIHRNLNRFGAKVVMGVGGSFDVLSGRLHRAPKWMRHVGLEWFFRLFQEPRRAARMIRLPLFPLKCLFQRSRAG